MIPFLFLLFSFFFFDCGSHRMELAQAMIDAGLADAEHVTELHDARARLFKARLRRLAQAVRQGREAPFLPPQHFDIVELADGRIHGFLQIRRLAVDEAVDL